MEENETLNEAVETEEVGMSADEESMWDDDSTVEFPEDADTESEESGEEFTEDDSEEDQPTDEESETDDNTETETDAAEEPQTKKFTLKHLDETKEVGEKEVVELAQKGMDYDRVKGKLEELKAKQSELDELKSFLEEIKGDFPTIDDLMDDTRAKILMRGDRSLTRDKALEMAKGKRKTSTSAPKEPEFGAEAFLAKYPDVKGTDIPKEVWDDVNVTGNLLLSYERYNDRKELETLKEEVNSLKKENEILSQNKKNSDRSTGSSKSSGKKAATDEFDDLWYNDD